MTEDIFTGPAVTLQTKLRCFRVEIPNPYGGTPSLAYCQEQLLVDSNGVSYGSTTVPSLCPDFPTLEATTYPIADPVTGTTQPISGAAVALWLAADYLARATAALTPPPATS